MSDLGMTVGLIKALAPSPEIDPEQVKQDVEDWLDDHPEATTTVQDGSITKAKLDSSLSKTVDDVGELKSALNIRTEKINKLTDDLLTGVSWETGSINTTTGADASSSRHLRSSYIYVGDSDSISIHVASGYKYYALLINSSKTDVVYTSGWKTTDSDILLNDYAGATYLRIMQLKTDDTKPDDNYVTATFKNEFTSMSDDVIRNTLYVNEGIEYLKGIFKNGSLADGVYLSAVAYRVASPNIITYNRRIKLTIANGYKVGVHFFVNNVFDMDSGWQTGEYVIPESAQFKIVIAKMTEDTSSTADVETFVHAVTINPRVSAEDVHAVSDRLSVIENPFRFKRYFSHIGVGQTENIIVPSQSISDVSRTKRLGFDVLEINVQETSDGHYICTHGSGGKFGAQFIGTDSSDVSDIVISSKTLDWIKQNVRFVSKYDKYKTPPFTLEQMLYECKRLSVIPFVQYVDDTELGIINSIMGKNNYILGIYNNNRPATDAVCISWTAIQDADEAVKKCELSGKSYILGVNHADSVFESFTDSDWKTYINTVHSAGYAISGAYMSASAVNKFFGIGWDVLASATQINEIDVGNLCNLYGDIEFGDFQTTGTVANHAISLANGNTITPSETLPSVFLGGGSLHIKFNGTLSISMGKISTSITSDGLEDVWISAYFEEQSPSFVLTANGNTTVYEILYKASRM